ncbi:pseudouridine synthase [Phormidesmis priestleyi]
MPERVQKILSQWGIASRRQAEQLIVEGRVRLNGQVAHLGDKVSLGVDHVEVDGKLVQSIAAPTGEIPRPKSLYFLLNKPAGIVSTCADPQGRSTVIDLLPKALQQGQGLHPVGRLDVESTGAILLTNDGELTYYLTHPRHIIPKTYQVLVAGSPSSAVLRQWRQGVMLEDRNTLPAQVKVLHRSDAQTLLEVILVEGRNRQIRKVAEQLGHSVLRLHRTAIGDIQLGRPPVLSGKYRPLESFEISLLKDQFDLTSIRLPAEIKEQSV